MHVYRLHATGFNVGKAASGTRGVQHLLWFQLCLRLGQSFSGDVRVHRAMCDSWEENNKPSRGWLRADVSRNISRTFQDRTAFHLREERQKQQHKVWIFSITEPQANTPPGVCWLQDRLIGKRQFKKPQPLVIVVAKTLLVDGGILKCWFQTNVPHYTSPPDAAQVVPETSQHITAGSNCTARTPSRLIEWWEHIGQQKSAGIEAALPSDIRGEGKQDVKKVLFCF